MVLVTGSVKAHGFAGRDGQIGASLEVTADQVKFLSGSAGDASAGGAPKSADDSVVEEDIPF